MKDCDPQAPGQCIAVTGMACRFPGARTAAQFWGNLRDGVESIRFFSDQEVLESGIPRQDLEAPNYVKAKGIVEDAELFDAAFFGLTPREAEAMDPQHRFALECAWEALEDAGCDPSRYSERIGVYMGQGTNSYLLNNILANPRFLKSVGEMQVSLQNRADHLTTRVSYKLDLRGPSLNVQTACSTSLAAIHLACQSLLNFQCEMALAGGVSIHVPLRAGYFYSQAGILSPDGHCRVFDAQAQGTLAGDGVGIVVLKRLEDALADGDCIRALILGSSVNNDGAGKIGFTAPGVDGQAEVIAEAIEVAGVDPESISYVEAHGTGTPLGDPIEVEALDRVFKSSTRKTGFCALGAVKSNVGHLDAAAGVAGFIKAAMALQHREIPPTLHFSQPNPRIRFEETAFYPARRLIPWKSGGKPRRAGVSSFGFGGTNVHAVLQEAPERKRAAAGKAWKLLPISARTRPALEEATQRLAQHLEWCPEEDLADIAYTLQTGRKAFERRRVLVCRDRAEAVKALQTLQHPSLFSAAEESRERSVAFLFPGQGTQYAGMARELYRSQAEFRRQADRCAKLLQPHLEFDLGQLLFGGDEQEVSKQQRQRILQTDAAQPALFVMEYALARLWMHWGIRPQAMLGHSIGEWVAACLAGVFSLQDALKLVALRGKWMQKMPPGAMLAVSLSEDSLRERLGEGLALASVNRPFQCVVSGPQAAIAKLKSQLAADGVACRLLETSHAFHSPMMEPMATLFQRQVAQAERHPPQIPFLSNSSGDWITASQAQDAGYWARQIVRPVLFSKALMRLFEDPLTILLEVGPGRTLTSIVRRHTSRPSGQQAIATLSNPKERRPQSADILQTLGKLWLAGTAVDWQGFSRGQQRLRVALPTYPFQRRRYWVEADRSGKAAMEIQAARKGFEEWFYVPAWSQLPPPLLDAAKEPAEGCWLFFQDSCGLGEQLADRLKSASLVRVSEGDGFKEHSRDSYSINKANQQDYQALLQAMQETGRLPSVIVHLWGVTPLDSRSEGLESSQQRGFWSLLCLAQAWGRLGIEAKARIWAVTSNAFSLTGQAACYPEKATVMGPVRVIPHEYPRLNCCCADVEALADNDWDSALLDALSQDLRAPLQHSLIAYRGPSRWVQSFQRLAWDGRRIPAGPLRRRGVYLITGGLGGIGLEVALWLARTCQARLALLSRSPFPQDERSRQEALRSGNGPLCRRIRKVEQMQDAGAEVLVLEADVADSAELNSAVRQAKERFGPIHGVFHCAGLPGSGLIHLKQPAQAEEVLAPKLEGTLNLERAFGKEKLDFLVLFSSLNAFWGTYGQADYTAANAFLDAFAQARWGHGASRILSINWGAWSGVGMRERMRKGASSGKGWTPGGHPLLERLQESLPDRQTYSIQLRVSKHWVLDEHRALGRGMLPGVAILEMARAALQSQSNTGPIELREVYFLQPLVADDDEAVEARLRVDKGEQGFTFSLWCASPSPAQGWLKCAQGEAICHPPQPQPTHDLNALIDGLGDSRLIEGDPRRQDANIGVRWHNQKKVYLGANQLVGEFELSKELEGDLEDYFLHPGLLDRVVGSCMGPFYGQKGTVYLPWSYQKVLIRGRFPPRIFCHGRFRADSPQRDEMPTNDFLVLDDKGRELVKIEGFSQRKTESLAGRIPTAELAGSSAPDWADDPNRHGLEISVEEGIEALVRILSSVSAPQLAVSPQDPNLVSERLQSPESHSAISELLPLEPSGPAHPRPELSAPFQAPQGKVQQALGAIWQEVLGIGQVGAHDNFFELGGDSVQIIQIVAKCSQAGLELSPQLAFENPTIARLADALESKGETASSDEAGQPQGSQSTAEAFPLAGLDEERLSKLIEQIEVPELP